MFVTHHRQEIGQKPMYGHDILGNIATRTLGMPLVEMAEMERAVRKDAEHPRSTMAMPPLIPA